MKAARLTQEFDSGCRSKFGGNWSESRWFTRWTFYSCRWYELIQWGDAGFYFPPMSFTKIDEFLFDVDGCLSSLAIGDGLWEMG